MFTHLLLSYTSQEDKSLLKNTTPFIVTSFFVIYSILLLTDGYYFLIFLAVGFSLGAFNSLNTNVEYKIPNYEKREVILLEEVRIVFTQKKLDITFKSVAQNKSNYFILL